MHVTILALMLLSTASPDPEPSSSPYQVYRLAMEHLATLKQPRYIDQTDEWREIRIAGGVASPRSWRERRIWDSLNRRECVLGVPFNPTDRVLISDSAFAPDAWLVRLGDHRPPPARDSVPNIEPDLSDLKTIGAVSVASKPFYNIHFIGIDPLTSGGSAWHLRLDPLENPMKHNIRELWINRQNFNIMTAILEGTYSPNPGASRAHTYVQEDFGEAGPYWLMLHSIWTYTPPGFGAPRFQFDATAVEMRFPESVPDWFFQESQFLKHLREVPAALEWPAPVPSAKP